MTGSTIPGVRYLRLASHADPRGSFREVWRASNFGTIEPALAHVGPLPPGGRASAGEAVSFVQANLSASEPGVLRGLHYHQRQLDYWTMCSGRAFVALVDLRPLISRGGDQPTVETRVLAAGDAVVVPSGIAHGFLALRRTELLYLTTNEYDGTDELGFAWDDPMAAVQWPTLEVTPEGLPILSDRDRNNPTLAELLARLRTSETPTGPT